MPYSATSPSRKSRSHCVQSSALARSRRAAARTLTGSRPSASISLYDAIAPAAVCERLAHDLLGMCQRFVLWFTRLSGVICDVRKVQRKNGAYAGQEEVRRRRKESPGRVRIQDEFQPRLPVNMRGMALRVPSNRDVSASARIQEAPARVRTGALAAPGLLFPLGGKPSRSLTRASDLTLAAPQTRSKLPNEKPGA